MTNELSLDELKELRGQLNEKLNNHPYTKELDEIIANKEFKVGVEAPEFSIKGMDGEDIELKNFAGKYILLDFWASWCGPCRNEMPNVVKLYKECKGKNFEIIGISLDQKPEPWKKAVKDLKMTWPQACDFQVWYGPVARKYNLSAIPYTVLINPEGRIEALNLRGEELINTIKTLLKNDKKNNPKMKKILVCMLVCLFCAGVQAQKTAKIKATAVGYTGKVIDFEFIDNTANNQQFPFKDNQLMEFEVELKEPGLMKVNAWLWMIVCPGDEIEMAIQFQGKNYKHVEFKGTPAAVTLNSAIRDGRMVRINDHYKTNPLAAVVTRCRYRPIMMPACGTGRRNRRFWKASATRWTRSHSTISMRNWRACTWTTW